MQTGLGLEDRSAWGLCIPPRREARRFSLSNMTGHGLRGARLRVGNGPFLDDNSELASPPWTSLRELEQASLHLERDGAERDPAYGKWLRMLIAPGRSLGEARPKASVLDERRRLWIAKFPSEHDSHDIGAWESVVNSLATRAGIRTAEGLHRHFGSRYHTFLARRFDRTDDGARIHFASAMTMLEQKDGAEGASYLDLAEVIMRQGAHPDRDLEELWRRIVFFICVSNLDDHLRNHGFLLERTGWSLAPAYDMNPVSTGQGLSLNISETDNTQNLTLAREVAGHFRLKAARANEIISQVMGVVSSWDSQAEAAGLSRADRERMAPAFRAATSHGG